MKNQLLIGLILLISTIGFTQDKNNKTSEEQKQVNAFAEHHTRTYAIAIKYGDYDMAKTAVYNMLSAYPGNDSLLYSLAYLYFQNKEYGPAVLSAKDLLARNPGHLGALQISGVGYESLGLKDKSLAAYETLYLKSNDYQTLYKVTFLQYDMDRLKECMTNADILLEKKESDSLTVFFPGKNKQQKEYPIKVSIYNLKGLVSKKNGDKASAKKYFQQALDLAPDFAIAKKNIEELDKK